MFDKKDTDQSYRELYDNLGIEPGLLSKTSIGQVLNEKYKKLNNKVRDDGIIAKTYAQNIISDFTNKKSEDNKPTIENSSPLYNRTEIEIFPMDHPDIIISESNTVSLVITDNDKKEQPDHLWKMMREYQINHHLSDADIILEITEFFDKYIIDYQVISNKEYNYYNDIIKNLRNLYESYKMKGE